MSVLDVGTEEFVSYLSQGKPFWTSGVRSQNGLDWEWRTGDQWSYSNWRQGEPSNTLGRENCMMINWDYTGAGVAEVNGLFNDLSCEYDQIYFMCQNQRISHEQGFIDPGKVYYSELLRR